jgi:F-type H+-transporting ATPase subunit a
MSPLLFAADTPLGHVKDKPVNLPQSIIDLGEIGGITVQTVSMFVALALLIWVMLVAAKRIRTGPKSQGNTRYVTHGRLSQMIEVIVLYLRDQLLVPVLGEHHTRRLLPFLMTLFFFILTINLIGMLPLEDVQNLIGYSIWGQEGSGFAIFGGTATSNISVTAMLAVVSFIVIQIHSFRELGFFGWLDHLTCGLMRGPKGLWLVVPIVFAVEIAGVFIKPAALAIRLFANMLGGHVLLATLLLLPHQMQVEVGMGTGGVAALTVVSGIVAVLITFLELFVAFLQAFIFMFLTAVFISLMSHEEHDEEHESESSGTGANVAPAH